MTRDNSNEGGARGGSLLSEREVARQLNISEVTLQMWRYQGKGPPFVRLLRMIRYRPADLEAWLLVQEVFPARSTGAPAPLASRAGSKGAGRDRARAAS